MFGLGMYEVIAVVAIAVLLFGSSRLPALARSVGESITELRRGIRDDQGEHKDE